MDIVLDKSTATEALIKITLKEKDYQPKVEEKVKEYSKKANIKGFRPGKVPPGLIKKLYGKSILIEEINEMLSKSINEYIKENDIKLIGEPLPNHEKTTGIDWDNQKEFEFEYQVGLIDDFSYDLSQKIKSYEVEVDKKTVDKTIEDLKKQHGEYTEPEESQEGDDFFGELTQESSDFKEEIWITADQIKPKEKKRFAGLKKEDEIRIDPKKVLKDTETAAKVLNRSEKELKDLKGDLLLKITKISRVKPAELNQELFDKVFGKDVVKDEKAFREKIKSTLEQNYEQDARNYTMKLIQDKLLETTKINVPENFYRKWILATNKEEVSEEDLESNYQKYEEELKWTLLVNRVSEDHEIKVEHTDVMDRAKEMIRAQFISYGMGDSISENLDAFAENYLKGNEGQNYYNTYNQVRSEKIMDLMLEKMEVSTKKVNPEEFSKIVSN